MKLFIDTANTDDIREAESLGVDGLLTVTPYYNKTTQRGLVKHFTALANSVKIPIILYNVPSRTGLNIAPETAKELSKLPRINGIKEASGNLEQVEKIRELCGDELNIWSGNDDQIYDLMERGGKGVISVLSNVLPKKTVELCNKFFAGDVKGSMDMQCEMFDLIKALFCEVNPIPVKAACNMMGWNAGPCKMPLCDMTDEHTEYVAGVMRKYGLIK